MEQNSAMPIEVRPGTAADRDFIVDCNARLARETEDKQLDAAVAYLKEEIRKKPVTVPPAPKYPNTSFIPTAATPQNNGNKP